ncbi:MAG: putative manganese-dependent inorganic diphosphatase [Verrucomicrobiota bacterium]
MTNEDSQPPTAETLIIGHKNPDTDAICSAIGYAEFLRQTSLPDARAVCCGQPNARTEWALSQAGIEQPSLVMDVRPRAVDICQRSVKVASPDDTIFDVYHTMMRSGHRTLPVTLLDGSVSGMLNLVDLLKLLVPIDPDGDAVRSVRSTLTNIAHALSARTLHIPEDPTREQNFLMLVAGSSEDVVLERIGAYPGKSLILIAGDRPNVQLRAVEEGVSCLVITGGFAPDDEVRQAAKKNGVPILSTERDTASTTQLIRGSRPVAQAVTKQFLSFEPEVPLDSIREIIESGDHPSQSLFPVTEKGSQRLFGVFSRTDLVNPKRRRLVLVDHNEFSQAVKGADQAEIIEVIDHHRLSGNLVTRDPVQFINKTVGSTCTIVAGFFRSHDLIPGEGIATCLCAGIISDTLKLTSPTTTKEDVEILGWLDGITAIDVNAFAEGFFGAGSLLKTCSPADAIASDRKEYEENGYRISISQIEEVGLNNFWPVHQQLDEAMSDLAASPDIDVACVLITDVTRHFSLLLIKGPPVVLDHIDYPLRAAGVYELEGVVSRKKQLFPWLSRLLKGIAPR